MLEVGEGGGGHISVKPVGVYKMSEKRSHTRFISIFDVKFFLKVFSIITLGITFLLRKNRNNIFCCLNKLKEMRG